ncbi:MAG: M23 family metallopeptidase [Ruminococcus sp.]|nr:M23 family metallopeptidase [Ruminococcus sp.]MCD7800743.1 M23 family metallopeptidase [Ruminococcus sp.]
MENKSKDGTKTNRMFFVAVSISLLMILIACIVVYPQVIPQDIENQLAEIQEDTTVLEETTTIEYNQVDNKALDIPKETEATTEQSVVTEDTIETTETSVETVVKNTQSTSAIMPIVDGEVINEFSNGELVKSATSGIWQTHNGMDIGAEVNTPVQAIDDGTITKVYEDALLGICVTIDHQDYTANYCNLDKGVLVTEGDVITKGTIIGTVGNTSVSESALESHLHFEVLKGGKYINPLDVLQ